MQADMTKVLGGIAHVHTAGNGDDAMAILKGEVVDVVLCDLRMPDITGLEMLRLCKARQPRARFILMTAYASVETAITALEDGAYDYLTKPFEPDEALDRIRASSMPSSRGVRLVTATRHDLDALVAQGAFLRELLFQIRVASVAVPPLRKRSEDIPVLAANVLGDSEAGSAGTRGFTAGAMERLCAAAWPGNVREFRSVIEHAAAHAGPDGIGLEALPEMDSGGHGVRDAVGNAELVGCVGAWPGGRGAAIPHGPAQAFRGRRCEGRCASVGREEELLPSLAPTRHSA